MSIATDIADYVLTITLQRPEKKNALNSEMYLAMAEALNAAQDDKAVRVVLIRGSQECFSSGNDLADFLDQPEGDAMPAPVLFLEQLIHFAKPIVAAVNGHAVGIGTTLLLHCDLVYAGPDAKLKLPFVNLGLCPEAASSYLLPQLLGHLRASEMLLLGENLNAEKAREFGLVNAVSDDFLSVAADKAKQLAALPPAAIQLTKKLMKAKSAQPMRESFESELQHFGERLSSAEAIEAMTAFMERRPADFSKF